MILVLTNPRTASTWFCKQLAEKYGYEDMQECFHELNCKGQHQQTLDNIILNPNKVVKVHAVHFESVEVDNLLLQLIDLSEKVYFLVRKDFNAELRSFYIANYVKDFISSWDEPFEREMRIVYKERDYLSLAEHVKKHLKLLSAVYKELDHNGELVYTEDIVKEEYKPVPRPVRWSKPPPDIDFDVSKLFEDS
jgi:hypothetical protein